MAAVDAAFAANFFRNPMLNNSHFEVSRMADPAYSRKLEERYEMFAELFVPEVIANIRGLSPRAEVQAVAIVGSASCFRRYNDIDVSACVKGLGIPGAPAKSYAFKTKVYNDHHVLVLKPVELFPYDEKNIDLKIYANYFFSKPIIYGAIPPMYIDGLSPMLREAFRNGLFKFIANMDRAKGDPKVLRKANHSLAVACRHAYTICGHEGRVLPDDFDRVITGLYGMDASDRYDASILLRLRDIVGLWNFDGLPPKEGSPAPQ